MALESWGHCCSIYQSGCITIGKNVYNSILGLFLCVPLNPMHGILKSIVVTSIYQA